MAHSLTQFHRGTKKPPQFLFAVPKPGADLYKQDWFVREAAGWQPDETYQEWRERKAKRWRAVKQAAWVLMGVAICAGLWVSLS